MRIGIIIICENGGDKVASSIQSVIDQDYEHLEILVIDNGSIDDSWEVINQFQDQIHVAHLEEPKSDVRELGMRIIFDDVDVFAFLTPGSIFAPNFARRVAEEFSKDFKRIGAVYVDSIIKGKRKYLSPDMDISENFALKKSVRAGKMLTVHIPEALVITT